MVSLYEVCMDFEKFRNRASIWNHFLIITSVVKSKHIHRVYNSVFMNYISFNSRHEKALEGITVCGEIRGRDRFIPIIMGLGMMDNTPMQVACIQLVNALVSTPDDLDFRLHLRNEFMRTGIIDLISVS